MSIIKTRKFLEKSGCGLVTMVAFGLMLLVGLAYYGGKGMGGREDTEVPPVVLAQSGDQDVTMRGVDLQFTEIQKQFGQSEGSMPPLMTASLYGQAFANELHRAAILDLAKKKGIEVSEDDVMKMAEQQADIRIQTFKAQLSKPGASQQEIQQAFKNMYGMDEAELRKSAIELVRQDLQDPAKRSERFAMSSGMELPGVYEKQVLLTDAQIKEGFDTWITKRIILHYEKNQGTKTEDLYAKLNKILKEIKGGLSFEAAMNRYTEDDAPKGKSKSESTVDLPRSIIDYNSVYEPLLKLKAGNISPIITTESGPAIFKVIKIQAKVPADFETKKSDYRSQRTREVASRKLQDDLKNLLEPKSVTWKSPGFKVLYEWLRATTEPANLSDRQKLLSELKTIEAEAAKIVTEGLDPAGPRAALLARFAALDELYKSASEAEKRKLAEKRIESISGVAELGEDPDLRLEQARLLLDLKKGEEAVASLLTAAETNFSFSDEGIKRYDDIVALRTKMGQDKAADAAAFKKVDEELARWRGEVSENLKNLAETNQDYSESGQKLYNDINNRTQKLQQKGLLTADQVTAIEKAQQTWRTEKLKIEQEAEKEKRAAEAKKKAEEAKKKAEAAKNKQPAAAAPKTSPKR